MYQFPEIASITLLGYYFLQEVDKSTWANFPEDVI